MKLKLLVKLVEKLLGIKSSPDESPADMYLPDKLLAMAIVFLAGGIVLTLWAILQFTVWKVIFAVFTIVFGVIALLCWNNQKIYVISDEQFTYTTMFGKTYTYSFSDIQGLRKNRDSMTLFVAGKKVHMESMAVLSDRLVESINKSLARLYELKE